MYEKEAAKVEYLEQLLFIKSGIVKATPEVDNLDYPSIHRVVTLSRLRHSAEVASLMKRAGKPTTTLADEKTEAEKIFEQELENGIREETH